MRERDERKLDMTLGDLRELLEELPITPELVNLALRTAWHEYDPVKNEYLRTIWTGS